MLVLENALFGLGSPLRMTRLTGTPRAYTASMVGSSRATPIKGIMKIKNTHIEWLGLIISVVIMLLASCTAKPSQLSMGGNLADTEWTLISYGIPGAETPVVASSRVTLKFGSAGQVSGSGGCNSFSGHYENRDNTVSFSAMNSTLMACMEQGRMDQEQRYFNALQTSGVFQLTGETLTLSVAGNEVLHFTKGINLK
jgi:heat shock protein HslJ